jgi:hypothetical protein
MVIGLRKQLSNTLADFLSSLSAASLSFQALQLRLFRTGKKEWQGMATGFHHLAVTVQQHFGDELAQYKVGNAVTVLIIHRRIFFPDHMQDNV